MTEILGAHEIDVLSKDEDLKNIEVDIDPEYLVEDKSNIGNLEIEDSSLEELKFEAKLQHPKIIKKGKITDYEVCNTRTGCYSCLRRLEESDLKAFGSGIISYFKMLKAYCIVFLIISIIHIPVYIMYTESNQSKPITSYQDLFFKTTIGNVASSLMNCDQTKLAPGKILINPVISMDCKSYTVYSIKAFGVSPDDISNINNKKNCNKFTSSQDISIDTSCSYLDTVKDLAAECIKNNQSTCKITIDSLDFASKCNSKFNADTAYISYVCYSKYIPIINWNLDRQTASIIVVSIDVASLIILLIAILYIGNKSWKASITYKQSVNQISDYTIHVLDLKFNSKDIEEQSAELIQHLEKAMQKELPEIFKSDLNYFYDLNYPVISDEKLDRVLKMNNLNEEIFKLRRKLQLNKKKLKEKGSAEILKLIDKKSTEYILFNSKLESNQSVTHISDVWITFNKMKYSTEINNAYSKYTKCTRCCLICCYQKKRINHL